MEYRKIIKFGNSSFVVSLPAAWIKKNNIKKGDSIFFEESNNSDLIFRPNNITTTIKKRIVITATDKSFPDLNREIISNYIKGFAVLEIIDENMLTRSKDIKDLLQNLIGIEILEQTQKRLIAKDLIDIDSISLSGIVKRMDVIIRSMLDDSFNCLTSNKKDVEEKIASIHDRDLDVNRLYFLAFRVLRILMNNPTLAAKKQISNSKIFSYATLVESLEKIADTIKRSTRQFPNLNTDKEYKEELMSLLQNLYELYIDSMKAYLNDDVQLAFSIGSSKDSFIENHNNFLKKYRDVETARLYDHLNSRLIYIRNIGRSIYQ